MSSPEGAVCLRIAPELRFGHIPGNAPTVEGLQRKLEPLSFSEATRSLPKDILPLHSEDLELKLVRVSIAEFTFGTMKFSVSSLGVKPAAQR